jgi:hypothetical protein
MGAGQKFSSGVFPAPLGRAVRVRVPLINTPLQRGALSGRGRGNRFNGFPPSGETVETVSQSSSSLNTQLKQGVNESRSVARQKYVVHPPTDAPAAIVFDGLSFHFL